MREGFRQMEKKKKLPSVFKREAIFMLIVPLFVILVLLLLFVLLLPKMR
jgi:phosphotransferase system  glucose/maltose/N-acetylglucosamine-specific IIC component